LDRRQSVVAAGFLLCLLLDFVDGGNMCLQNVGVSLIYIVLELRRLLFIVTVRRTSNQTEEFGQGGWFKGSNCGP
jgi:hypothetical protein